MQPSDLRVALFSGNYNYTRDGANQALNSLVGHLLSRGVTVRVYSPTVAEPALSRVVIGPATRRIRSSTHRPRRMVAA